MVFTALSLVAIIFFGTVFDDFSRSLLSLIFAVVFLLVFEHYFSRGWNHFLVLSISSMIPYCFWLALDSWHHQEDRYDIFLLLKILPFAAALTIGLDFVFRHLRNQDLNAVRNRPTSAKSRVRGRTLRRLS